ncbi:MFS transporter [Nocardioides bizhenqiangii]|uniref:MFS transporter n=1 Tax=Nocardioides bizhenqiangii TaxID=3095076 RepID=A0ABZ0ZUT8_9ACTN|nr:MULTISPECIES: MFS transporter [unclassified Nocardioides]MDZ5623099.1 MFS transporter [Nocardioides sp. HM23]WQQ28075.1 MFS transporter [Nocardioides sp. HM61]
MSRIIDAVAPARLGSGFRWLMASSWTSNLGDGIALAAGPLLVASETRSPLLVSLAVVLQQLPWLLFGLYAGAIADRVDRLRLVVVANLLRGVVLVALGATIVTGVVNIGVVLGALFLVGTAEVFVDTAAGTLMPMLVEKRDLGVAHARLQTGFITLNQLAGAPIGAALFALGRAWPFGVQVVAVVLSAVLVVRIALPPGPVRDASDTHVLRDIAEGVRWLLDHPPVRTLALVIVTFNVTWAAAWSVLVLYSLEVLDMGPVGYGLLTTMAAVGGLVSTPWFGWLERRVPLATLMRTCLLLEVLMHLALALTREAWIAMVILFGFGMYAFIWGALSAAVRQRSVPTEFQGRVGSVYGVGVYGGIVVGAGLGGLIAEYAGIVAPYWFAFVGSGITLALVWRQLAHVAHADEEIRRSEEESAPGQGPGR